MYRRLTVRGVRAYSRSVRDHLLGRGVGRPPPPKAFTCKDVVGEIQRLIQPNINEVFKILVFHIDILFGFS